MIVLTKSNSFLIKWIAEVLGVIMNLIFSLISSMGIPSVGLAIILFTIVIYMLMTPLQIKQQRFSKMQAIMQPEIQKIQDKYKNRKDTESQQRQNEEIQAVYQKYGVNAAGSCVQLLIQMPVLFALYQVIYRIPGYISLIREQLETVAVTSGFADFFGTFVTNLSDATVTRNFSSGETANIIDTLYNLNSSQWAALLSDSGAGEFSEILNKAHEYVTKVTYFLGLSISDSPMNILKEAWSSKTWIMIFAAVLVPLLAYLTQVLNFKLMPQAKEKKKGEETGMEASMKSMNTMMPLMSAFFCLTLPVGIGIYWISGALVRSAQMVAINKYLDKEDLDSIIEKNKEKAAKKLEKKGYAPQKITQEASRNVRRLEIDKKIEADKNSELKSNGNAKYKKGSIADRANMVRDYNESHKK